MITQQPEAPSTPAMASPGQPTQVDSPPPRAEGSTLRARIERHGLWTYAALAYGISWTLLLGGYFATRAGLLDVDGTPVALMIQAAAAGPLIAALVIISYTRGTAGLASLARSLIRWRITPRWYAFAFLGIPLIMVGAMGALHPAEMSSALSHNWTRLLTQLPIVVLWLTLVTGLAEEPGWRGFAQPMANHRYRPLVAASTVSVMWALWHLPNALFGQTVTETLLHLLATAVNGFVLAWAYNATRGSVLFVMLLHAAQNATAGLVQSLLQEAFTASQYYLVSAFVFGALMLIVAVATRGRLGVSDLTNVQ
jgi:uncharacterized protein